MDKKIEDLKMLFDEEAVKKRTKELAAQINESFGQVEDLTVICVLKGSSIFCCDLIKHLKMPVQLEFIKVSSYGNAQVSSGHVKALDLTLPALKDKNVLVVEERLTKGVYGVQAAGGSIECIFSLVRRTAGMRGNSFIDDILCKAAVASFSDG